MSTIETVRHVLQFTQKFGDAMIDDMRDAPLLQPTPRGGNHPMWIVGHIALSEAGLRSMIDEKPNPLDKWMHLFNRGTTPSTDASIYPNYDEVVHAYRDVRRETMALLDELDETEVTNKPKAVPTDFEAFFQTIGQVLMFLPTHQEFHLGQLADARRAAGRPSLFETVDAM